MKWMKWMKWVKWVEWVEWEMAYRILQNRPNTATDRIAKLCVKPCALIIGKIVSESIFN